MWTRFMDMHSGGGSKESFDKCYIEAPQEEAEVIFYNRFGHSPYRASCTCCGEDYSISEYESLAQATAYDRGCKWRKDGYDVESGKETLEAHIKRKDVLVILSEDIKPEERQGTVPTQGYVWL